MEFWKKVREREKGRMEIWKEKRRKKKFAGVMEKKERIL